MPPFKIDDKVKVLNEVACALGKVHKVLYVFESSCFIIPGGGYFHYRLTLVSRKMITL